MSNFNRQEHRKIKKQRSKTLFGNIQRPRVIISKSNRYLTAQAVDDVNQKTLAYLSTHELVVLNEEAKTNLRKSYKSKEMAEKLGSEFAKLLVDKNINNIVFDRNGYIYHGKIEVFCKPMRKLGISF
ncbi:MAG: 50S ribosomal protein L18 [Mycoplasmataceae bacterium]|nr:MAG: 50S ribosomal protein L18 [Mycoplasmataceae bacterium]